MANINLTYEDDPVVYEDTSLPKAAPTQWTEPAARSYAAKLTFASGDEDEATRERIVSELVNEGVSPTAKEFEQHLSRTDKMTKVGVAGEIAGEVGADTALSVLEDRLTNTDDVIDEAATAAYGAFAYSDRDLEEYLNATEREQTAIQQIREEYNDNMQFTGGTVGNVFEFLEAVVPFVESASVVRLKNRLEDEFGVDLGSSVGGMFLSGSLKETMREWMYSLPAEERLGVMRFVAENAADVSGVFTDNDFIKQNILHGVASESIDAFLAGELDEDKLISNTVSVLDTMMIGGIARGIMRGADVVGGVAKDSSAAKAMRLNKEAGTSLQADALIDTSGKKAQSLGTTNEDIIMEGLLPKYDKFEQSGLVSSDKLNRRLELANAVASRSRDISTHLTEVEKLAQKHKLEEMLESTKGASLWKNDSTIVRTDNGHSVSAVFGKDSSRGFSADEINDVVATFKKRYPNTEITTTAKTYTGRTRTVVDEVEDVVPQEQIVKKVRERLVERASRKLPPASKATEQVIAKEQRAIQEAKDNIARLDAGEFDSLTGQAKRMWTVENKPKKTKVTREEAIEDGDEFFVNLNFHDDFRVGSGGAFHLDDIYIGGTKAKYLADVSSALAQHLSDSFYRAFDRSRGTEKMMHELLQPFTQASNTAKKHIVSLLDEGKTIEKTFTPDELLERLPTDLKQKDLNQIIEGYLSVRMAADATYSVMNKVLRDDLREKGFQHINFGEEFNALATRMSDSAADVIRVAYDPVSKRTLNNREIQELREQGYNVYTSRELHGEGEGLTNHLIVGGAVEVNNLPSQVLKYREGYLPRMYNEQYFVSVKPKAAVINGERVTGDLVPSKSLLVAKSKKQAQATVERLKAENPDMEVEWRNARELTQTDRMSNELDVEASTGGLFFSKRGEHIKDINNNLAETEDVVGSIQRMASATAAKVELKPVIDLMKKRWMATFGHLTQGKYPVSVDIIKASSKRLSDPVVAKAISSWDYINLTENTGLASQQWRAASVRFGEWVEDVTGSEKLGSMFRTTVADRSPLSVARGTTFVATIVLNPLRQLFIQSQQFLFLSGVDSGVLTGAVQRQALPLLIHSWFKEGANTAALAKAAGMSEKEFLDMSKALKDSGLIEAVDSHLVGRDALMSVSNEITNGLAGKVKQLGQNTISKAISSVRSGGFDAGEIINIAHTYVVARRRFIKNNPKVDVNSKEALAKIAADTRQLALGMTSAGSFGYQRGALSMATQFLSVQHKAILAMMRGVPGLSKYGNKALTVNEARKIAMFQTLLYGAAGTGMYALVDGALEQLGMNDISPEARHIIYGGVYDWLMNGVLTAIGNDPTNLSFASNLSAGQGMFESITTLIGDTLGGGKGIVEIAMGPSFSVASKFGDAFRTTTNIMGAAAEGYEISPEEFKLVFTDIAKISSGVNNALKMRAMMRHGAYVDANRNAIPIPANQIEQFMAGVLGVQSFGVEGFYDYIKGSKEHKDMIKQTALDYYNDISRLVTFENSSGYASIDKINAHVKAWQHLMHFALGEADRQQVMLEFEQIVKQRQGDGDNNLANEIAKAAMQNSLGSSFNDIIGGMERKGIVQSEQAQKLMELRKLLEGESE